MAEEPRDELIGELADLYAVKLALILVPVRMLLRSVERQELAGAIDKLVCDVTVELRLVLAEYDITRKG